MDYYLDISILPDPEFPTHVLMNALYSKLHKALYDLRSTSIGVSFPKQKITLGNLLRLHGKKEALQDLQNLNWIGGMSGYCMVSPFLPVPAYAKFRMVSRKQPTMSQSKLRRLIKRSSMTEGEIRQYKAKMFSKGLDSPYIDLVSGSNGQRHRRYIEFGELLDEPTPGKFDLFGLSKTATVPWFD
ncbi:MULTISPECIES: type I-F CRISPR-associated endoribonuclease Cas6/Csy4 [unclassified Legionella]|uniref:type I-F CRISPR-associated endoribonuclease Cas6/Csy4 n=1 Tax=unclassified Legionella TaxID=2622702 RepID=UPI00105486ED|nr:MULTISPECIES: type I-F CRISPR-associated endoribonuclease Cas6/Csy4 [unclassified Legionella]MDI9817691.1 type I-F CRISPR-associated endoribonuclease Cas6/Csy4 [Legionella sp. PL877]